MSISKKLLSDTALYGISTIVSRFVYFLLVPLHTYIFKEPAQLSDNSELFLWATILNIVYTFGMETTFFRYGTKPETRQYYFNTIFTAVLSVSLTLSTLFILFAEPLINFMNYPDKARLIVWMAIIIAIDAFAALPFARLRMEGKAKKFVRIRLTNIGINIFFNLFFLGFCKQVSEGNLAAWAKPFVAFVYNESLGPDYIIWANLLANLYLIWALRGELAGFRFVFNWKAFQPLWLYGFPILVMGLAGNINQTADRLLFRSLLPDGFYAGFSTEDAFSIYTNCYKLAIVMAIVTQAFRYAADPFFFSKAEDKNAPQVFAQVMKWFIIACCFIWLSVSINLDIFGYMVSEKFRSGLVAVPILLFAQLLVGVYWNLSVWFKLTDKTSYGTKITAIGMVISVTLSMLLIPRFGYVGSAFSFATSSFIMVVICYFWGQKYFPVPYKIASAGFYVGLAFLLILVSNFFVFSEMAISLVFHLFIIFVFISAVFLIEKKKFFNFLQ